MVMSLNGKGEHWCIVLVVVERDGACGGTHARGSSVSRVRRVELTVAHFPSSLALNADGALLAAGTSTGEVWLWRVADRMPLLAVDGHTGTV